MREQAIQTAITKYIEKQGGYWVKVVTASKSGVPDLLVCAPTVITQDMVGQTIGCFIGLEVKTATGKPSELQLYNIEKIQKACGLAGVVRSVEDVKALLSSPE